MNNGNTIAARAMLDRILKLCGSGLSPEQIAIDILDADQETALFRVRMLVDIIIDYARRSDMENSSMAAHCHASGEILAVVPQERGGSLSNLEAGGQHIQTGGNGRG